MASVFLGLGSNIGDRQQQLKRAITEIKKHARLIKQSSIYETDPWGNELQDKFLNQCLEIQTSLSPNHLLSTLKSIEKTLGRVEREKWGPREIDIDILFYDDLIINSDTLEVPHPHLHERAFVLVPLNEIAPDLIHPSLKQPVRKIVHKVKPDGIKLYYRNELSKRD